MPEEAFSRLELNIGGVDQLEMLKSKGLGQ
jgi:hypothetical protein